MTTYKEDLFLDECLPACVSVCWCRRKPEEGTGSSGTGVMDGFKSPNEFWEWSHPGRL